MAALDALDARRRGTTVVGESGFDGRRVDAPADGVDAVESAGEDERVVAVEFLEARGEGAGVDEAAGFVDDEEGEDDPGSDSIDCFVRWHCDCTYIVDGMRSG